jgi:peptidoglycan LD-endopeptidase LytH
VKLLNFVLGLLTGVVCTYLVLTRLWWPDVRIPEALAQRVAMVPNAVPSASPAPTEPQPFATPALADTSSAASPSPSATPIEIQPAPLPAPSPSAEARAPEPPILTSDLDRLRSRALVLPVAGIERKSLQDNFDDDRAGRHHEAIDILASRGTAVIAVDDGKIEKLFTSVRGGLTVYQFDARGEYCYYYAHLDGYAPGLTQGKTVRKGDVIGFVGTTGNAPPQTPHLHFTIFRLGAEKRWWEGTAINAYPLWGNSITP